MKVEIDKNSGFCFGVVNAIQKAEEELEKGVLYSIGDIVHNSLEVERLKSLGLVTIDHDTFSKLTHCRVLFRAHGEPPSSYEIARKNHIEVIDASCPVVLNLQQKIRTAFEFVKKEGGQIVIYGKRGHAEVNGLVAQTNGEAVIVEQEEDIERIDFSRPLILFSQTTKSLEGFMEIVKKVQGKAQNSVVVNDTICRKVVNRIPQLRTFAVQHDVVLFVSGEKSSNGKQLFAVCRAVNPRTYFIQGIADLRAEMFDGAKSVGISGATSTPHWVMESVAEEFKRRDDHCSCEI